MGCHNINIKHRSSIDFQLTIIETSSKQISSNYFHLQLFHYFSWILKLRFQTSRNREQFLWTMQNRMTGFVYSKQSHTLKKPLKGKSAAGRKAWFWVNEITYCFNTRRPEVLCSVNITNNPNLLIFINYFF